MLWKVTIDYRNAATKGQCDKLKLLKKEDIKGYERNELENHSVTHGKLAYQEYRAACKIADKAKQLKKQVKIRGNMALCLYVSNNFLEAQLYALSAITLIMQNSNKITQKVLIEAKNIFDKVKDVNSTEETVNLNTEIVLKNNDLALVEFVDRNFSYFEKRSFQSSIDEDIKKLGNKLIFKPDHSLVHYQASNEEILRAKERAKLIKQEEDSLWWLLRVKHLQSE